MSLSQVCYRMRFVSWIFENVSLNTLEITLYFITKDKILILHSEHVVLVILNQTVGLRFNVYLLNLILN